MVNMHACILALSPVRIMYVMQWYYYPTWSCLYIITMFTPLSSRLWLLIHSSYLPSWNFMSKASLVWRRASSCKSPSCQGISVACFFMTSSLTLNLSRFFSEPGVKCCSGEIGELNLRVCRESYEWNIQVFQLLCLKCRPGFSLYKAKAFAATHSPGLQIILSVQLWRHLALAGRFSVAPCHRFSRMLFVYALYAFPPGRTWRSHVM